MVLLGLKASTDKRQIIDRLQYHPQVFEFHLTENDMTVDGLKQLADDIDWIKATTTNKIILHEPIRYHNHQMEMILPEKYDPEFYHFMMTSITKIIDLAREKNILALVHGAFNKETGKYLQMYSNFDAAETELLRRLDYFAKYGGKHLCVENSISPLWGYADPKIRQLAKEHHYQLAFDTSHVFIQSHGSNQILQEALRDLYHQIVHYHLVDSNGEFHDSLPLGQGKINWQKVLPLLNPHATSIYEINLINQLDATEQVASHRYLTNLIAQKHLS